MTIRCRASRHQHAAVSATHILRDAAAPFGFSGYEIPPTVILTIDMRYPVTFQKSKYMAKAAETTRPILLVGRSAWTARWAAVLGESGFQLLLCSREGDCGLGNDPVFVYSHALPAIVMLQVMEGTADEWRNSAKTVSDLRRIDKETRRVQGARVVLVGSTSTVCGFAGRLGVDYCYEDVKSVCVLLDCLSSTSTQSPLHNPATSLVYAAGAGSTR